jgi:hypothetical protein
MRHGWWRRRDSATGLLKKFSSRYVSLPIVTQIRHCDAPSAVDWRSALLSDQLRGSREPFVLLSGVLRFFSLDIFR